VKKSGRSGQSEAPGEPCPSAEGFVRDGRGRINPPGFPSRGEGEEGTENLHPRKRLPVDSVGRVAYTPCTPLYYKDCY
jgi:hypothetical protein